jgi:glycosyltransferase involved in cell wall biosynthesis
VYVRVAMTLEQCWHRVPGGTAVAALELARELAGRPGVEVVGVAGRHSAPPLEPWRPPVPIRHLPLPGPALYEGWHYASWPKVQRATGPVDVIHATGVALPPRSAPLVTTIHDLSFLAYPEHFSHAGRRFFRRALKLTRERADLVLCSSEATVEHCARAGLDRSRLRHVPLGVRVERASEAEVKRVRSLYGLDGRYLLWTGTIEPRKNLPGLLRAVELADTDAELVLVGPKGWNEEIRPQPRVRMLGFVPGEDLGPLYAGAEAFCFPSLLEGFGFPVLEAMAQGTPVVTSRGTSTEELARGAGVLVDPHDPASIADGIERALADDGTLAAAGLQRAAEYTWARSADLVLAAYEEVTLRRAEGAGSAPTAPPR